MTHEQRIAQQITRLLDDGVAGLDTATVERLANARQQAEALAVGKVLAVPVETVRAGNIHLLSAPHAHGHRSWIAALVVLTVGLLALFAWQQSSTPRPPVETDTLLLASELPPEAYVDKGFHAWLEDSSQL